MPSSTSPSDRLREIKRDALSYASLFSVFGFMGISLFIIGYFIGTTAKFPIFFTLMWYIPLAVGLYMFYFSYGVYKNEVRHELEMDKIMGRFQ